MNVKGNVYHHQRNDKKNIFRFKTSFHVFERVEMTWRQAFLVWGELSPGEHQETPGLAQPGSALWGSRSNASAILSLFKSFGELGKTEFSFNNWLGFCLDFLRNDYIG